MSHAVARPHPPASALPCTTAITGFAQRRSCRSRSPSFFASARFSAGPSCCMLASSERSAPAQKSAPAPRRATMLVLLSTSAREMTPCSSRTRWESRAFFFSGRLSRIVPTPAFSEYSTLLTHHRVVHDRHLRWDRDPATPACPLRDLLWNGQL